MLPVDLFFVLSGFLITSILLTHDMSHRFLVSFYARRALRIWPVYYLSLMVLVLWNPFLPVPASLDGLPYFATFTQNITYYWSNSAPAFIPAFRHTWSVAIEEQFYMFGRRRSVVGGENFLGHAVLDHRGRHDAEFFNSIAGS